MKILQALKHSSKRLLSPQTSSYFRFSTVTASELYNPYTREFLSSKNYLTQDEIFTKMTNTTLAFKKWKTVDLDQRINLVT